MVWSHLEVFLYVQVISSVLTLRSVENNNNGIRRLLERHNNGGEDQRNHNSGWNNDRIIDQSTYSEQQPNTERKATIAKDRITYPEWNGKTGYDQKTDGSSTATSFNDNNKNGHGHSGWNWWNKKSGSKESTAGSTGTKSSVHGYTSGTRTTGNKNNWNFWPCFGVGYQEDPHSNSKSSEKNSAESGSKERSSNRGSWGHGSQWNQTAAPEPSATDARHKSSSVSVAAIIATRTTYLPLPSLSVDTSRSSPTAYLTSISATANGEIQSAATIATASLVTGINERDANDNSRSRPSSQTVIIQIRNSTSPAMASQSGTQPVSISTTQSAFHTTNDRTTTTSSPISESTSTLPLLRTSITITIKESSAATVTAISSSFASLSPKITTATTRTTTQAITVLLSLSPPSVAPDTASTETGIVSASGCTTSASATAGTVTPPGRNSSSSATTGTAIALGGTGSASATSETVTSSDNTVSPTTEIVSVPSGTVTVTTASGTVSSASFTVGGTSGAISTATRTLTASRGTSSAPTTTGTVSTATGTFTMSDSTASPTTSAVTSTFGTVPATSGTVSSYVGTVSTASGIVIASVSTASAVAGTLTTSADTTPATVGTVATAVTVSTETGTVSISAGSATVTSGTVSAATGTVVASGSTVSSYVGTVSAASGTVIASVSTASAVGGTLATGASTTLGTVGNVTATSVTVSTATGTVTASGGTISPSATSGTVTASSIDSISAGSATATAGTVSPATGTVIASGSTASPTTGTVTATSGRVSAVTATVTVSGRTVSQTSGTLTVTYGRFSAEPGTVAASGSTVSPVSDTLTTSASTTSETVGTVSSSGHTVPATSGTAVILTSVRTPWSTMSQAEQHTADSTSTGMRTTGFTTGRAKLPPMDSEANNNNSSECIDWSAVEDDDPQRQPEDIKHSAKKITSSRTSSHSNGSWGHNLDPDINYRVRNSSIPEIEKWSGISKSGHGYNFGSSASSESGSTDYYNGSSEAHFKDLERQEIEDEAFLMAWDMFTALLQENSMRLSNFNLEEWNSTTNNSSYRRTMDDILANKKFAIQFDDISITNSLNLTRQQIEDEVFLRSWEMFTTLNQATGGNLDETDSESTTSNRSRSNSDLSVDLQFIQGRTGRTGSVEEAVETCLDDDYSSDLNSTEVQLNTTTQQQKLQQIDSFESSWKLNVVNESVVVGSALESLVLSHNSSTACESLITSSLSCYQSQVVDQETAVSEMLQTSSIQAKVNSCFTRNNCSEPNYNLAIGQEFSGQNKISFETLKNWWDALPLQQHQCALNTDGQLKKVAPFAYCLKQQAPDFVLQLKNVPGSMESEHSPDLQIRYRIREALQNCSSAASVSTCILEEVESKSYVQSACAVRNTCNLQISTRYMKCSDENKFEQFIDAACSCENQTRLETWISMAKALRPPGSTMTSGQLLVLLRTLSMQANITLSQCGIPGPDLVQIFSDFTASGSDVDASDSYIQIRHVFSSYLAYVDVQNDDRLLYVSLCSASAC